MRSGQLFKYHQRILDARALGSEFCNHLEEIHSLKIVTLFLYRFNFYKDNGGRVTP